MSRYNVFTDEKWDNIYLDYMCGKFTNREQNFIRGITGNYSVVLNLVNTGENCTDGKNIKVTVSKWEIPSMKRINRYMGTFFTPEEFTKTTTRAVEIHEAGHVLFSQETLKLRKRDTGNRNKKVLGYIENTIEDGYIERALVSYKKSFQKYLVYSNLYTMFSYPKLSEFEKKSKLQAFLTRALEKFVVGRIKGRVSDDIQEFADMTDEIYRKAVTNPDAQERLDAAVEIYDLIKPLIDEAAEQGNADDVEYDYSSDIENATGDASFTAPDVKITNTVFDDNNDENGDSDDDKQGKSSNSAKKDASELKVELQKEAQKEKAEEKNEEISTPDEQNIDYGSNNAKIEIQCIRPTGDDKIASDTYNEYSSEILFTKKNFIKKLRLLLEQNQEDYIDDLEMGHTINTSKICKKDKSFWREAADVKKPLPLRITILADLSGSTCGLIKDMKRAIILLTQTANALKIPIQVIGEQAIYGLDKIYHYMALDFKDNPIQNYNICKMESQEGTREGASLRWIKHQLTQMYPENRNLIIVLSDGIPEHYGQFFAEENLVADAHAAANEIYKLPNFELIGIAMGDKNLYNDLCKIYKKTIMCDNIDNLPKLMVDVLRKNLLR